jgi:tetratricopeptide (TPR) repeat protein
MSTLRDRYLELLDQITTLTLQGKIRSKAQVYKLLLAGIEAGTGEIFERCLAERISSTKAQLDTKLKAARVLRALEMVQGEWERWQQENQARDRVTATVEQIFNSDTPLLALFKVLDPNQNEPFLFDQLSTLVAALRNGEQDDLAQGIETGLAAFSAVEPYLVSWLYESGQNLGFGGIAPEHQPWALWSQHIEVELIKTFVKALAQERSLLDWVRGQLRLESSGVVGLAVFFQALQRSLVSWFDRQPYDAQIGKQLSNRTLLTFASIWTQFWQGLQHSDRTHLAEASFQVTLQFLRLFANRPDFPLYGGILLSLGGNSLREALLYLDEPLGRWEQTPEKARLLTLLGYSQRFLGRDERAIAFHQEALEIARQTEDRCCAIANLNHLSRTYAARQEYEEASRASQRALISAREVGDRAGEANALVNFGYSEVLAATVLERFDEESYERAIAYLEQGLALSERLGDLKALALAYYSLGAACVIRDRAQAALAYLAKALELSQQVGDAYLQGLTWVYLAEAYYGLSMLQNTVTYASLALYSLDQMGAKDWRQAAGLLAIARGQSGEDAFNAALTAARPDIITAIGVDGYDYLPQLLQKYQDGDNNR